MNLTLGLKYLGLLLLGLMAGSSFALVVGVGPTLENLSILAYLEFHRNWHQSFSMMSPVVYALALLTLSANMYLSRHRWKSMEFLLMLFAVICVLNELLMTYMGNLPLNQLITSWDLLSPPPDWMDIRSQWLWFMYIRCALLVAGFSLLLASIFMMKPVRSSQPDAFAAA
ncbi:DUF1772 domain-containing protein [Bdellovibrio bacteriovorus]|uniref:DUF1772 domain-containing protein n=1 Tax=Bdellovibrio bacteriovorus TaxID=959 RepID=UPI0021CEF029|nr:DUF1772 domain-containing protein [Bdellovibrio bacteriovorus]UXR64080.1 DUF1772 domain-containing protein [Bdellovibrio bacteriovorus]